MIETLRRRFPEVVLLWTAVSFLVLFFELVITRHTEELQMVGTVAALIGAIAALLALGPPLLRRLAVVVLALVALAGLVGTAAHWKEGLESSGYAYEYDDDDYYEYKDGESKPPPLAPLGLSGTALLGILAAFARQED